MEGSLHISHDLWKLTLSPLNFMPQNEGSTCSPLDRVGHSSSVGLDVQKIGLLYSSDAGQNAIGRATTVGLGRTGS